MQSALMRRWPAAVAVLAGTALSALFLWFLLGAEGNNDTYPTPQRSADNGQFAAETIRRGETVDNGGGVPTSPVEIDAANRFDQAIQHIVKAADAMLLDEADQAAAALADIVAQDPDANCRKLAGVLTKVVSDDKSNRDIRVRRSGFLFLAFPKQSTSFACEYLLSDWKQPLGEPYRTAWQEVELSVLSDYACEAVSIQADQDLCKSFVFSLRRRLLRDTAGGAEVFTPILQLFPALTDTYLCDPVLSFVLKDVCLHYEVGKRPEFAHLPVGITEAHYATFADLIAPLADDLRLGTRLRTQIAHILGKNQVLSQADILSALGKVSDWSEAARLVAAYLRADPQFREIDKLLAALLAHGLDAGEAHHALEAVSKTA